MLSNPLRSAVSDISARFLNLWTARSCSLLPVALACSLLVLSGCSRFRSKPAVQHVYVTAKQTYLRDRVAAVSNRTATVQNGDVLQVLVHGRRFYHVKTDKGEVGWIDEKAVVTQDVYDAFQDLARAHAKTPAVASAVVRDEVNLHLKPGRETERFYRLQEGDKLQLLQRATLPRPLPAGAIARPQPKPVDKSGQASTDSTPASPVPMEDWWLAIDSKGHAGWLLSRMIDVDAPDTLTRYSEGQKFVGAYVLTTVYDPGAEQENKNIPEYVTVLAPYSAGLPFDFNQVRVFTWNIKMHRYETAFREKNIAGYLPVKLGMEKDPYGKSPLAQTALPTFTYRVLSAAAPPVVPDPTTGFITPGETISKTYRLEGNIVHRVAPPGYKDPPIARPAPEEQKGKRGRRR